MKKMLLVEGNLKGANQEFTENGIKTHTESLQESISYYTDSLDIDSVYPSSDKDIFDKIKDLNKYDGLIWGGSSLNIYSDTKEIRRQIEFMKECQKKVKNILGGLSLPFFAGVKMPAVVGPITHDLIVKNSVLKNWELASHLQRRHQSHLPHRGASDNAGCWQEAAYAAKSAAHPHATNRL